MEINKRSRLKKGGKGNKSRIKGELLEDRRLNSSKRLLEGLRVIPKKGEDRYLTKNEVDDYFEREHEFIEDGFELTIKEFGLMCDRLEEVLRKFDEMVLGGFSEETLERVEEELGRKCIPCFVALPKNEPRYIQLLFAIGRPNQSNSMQFEDICKEAVALKGNDGEMFLYLLRKVILEDKGLLERNLFWLKREDRFEEPPVTEWEYDVWFGKQENNARSTKMSIKYQLMVHLIENV